MRPALALFLAFALAGCPSTDTHEHPEITSWTLDPLTVAAGGDLSSTFELMHFSLTGEEGDEHDHEGDMAMDAGDNTGHVHIYLDDLETNPILMQVTLEDTVTLDAATAEGTHTLIARLHNADHEIIEPQVLEEIEIEVTAR